VWKVSLQTPFSGDCARGKSGGSKSEEEEFTEKMLTCDNSGDCKWEERDSYMWWDELHPSEQTGRLVAQEVVKKLDGKSIY
jgi:phospholipase/lecithinase/hemolysin